MLYVIENKRTGELITGTDYASGLNKSGHYKQLYNTEYHPPIVLNDANCAIGTKRVALEIYNRRIDMSKHVLRTLYLDTRECKSKNKEIRELLDKWDNGIEF